MKSATATTHVQSSRGFKDTVIDTVVNVARRLPRGRTALFRAAHWVTGRPEKVIGTVDHQRFCVDVRDEGIALRAYLMDEWEPEVSRVLSALLKPGSSFVDVGANKGYFCLLAAKRVLPGGSVVSYEPHPGNARDIEITIAANGYGHWRNRPVAASASAGSVRLYTPGWNAGMSGWGSFHRPCDEFIDVETVTLADDLAALQIESVDVMKIDVEGHEIEVLEGASQLLSCGRIRNLLVEIHLTELQPLGISRLFELMQRFDYNSYTIVEGKHLNCSIILRELVRPVTCREIQLIEASPRNRPHVIWTKSKIT